MVIYIYFFIIIYFIFLCVRVQINRLQLQPETRTSQNPLPLSDRAAESSQPCLQEILRRPAEEEVSKTIHCMKTCCMFNGDTLTYLCPSVLFLNSCGNMFVVAGCNAEFSSTLTSGSRHLSRCSLGSPVRGTTPWTVSERRRCTRVTWARRSTQLGRLRTSRLQMRTILIYL